MRITMAQLNPVVGDIEGNIARVLDALHIAIAEDADLVVLPELIVTGYPPKDLLEMPAFIKQVGKALERIVEASKEFPSLGVILGAPTPTDLPEGKPLFNTAFLVSNGEILFRQSKMLLPTYDVFDELRYFRAAVDNDVVSFKGEMLGLSVCEDAWNEPDPWNKRPYPCDPIEMLVKKGATLLINISASPFSLGKEEVRYKLIREHATSHKLDFVFVNQVGGNDDLVFDGGSLYVDKTGAARHVFPSFEETVVTVDTSSEDAPQRYDFEEPIESIYRALVLGTRDYVRKCGFSKVVIGLSGGIDSAVTAVIAAEAVGRENVVVLAMPSPYSLPESLDDAKTLANNLGLTLDVIEISDVMTAYDKALSSAFVGKEPDVTEENIQARIRGNLLMAYSNKFGYLPLSTGNKSELAVGYCTLYGDMSGGLAVISDVPKTMVFKLAGYVNSKRKVIPKRIVERAPSAELKPNQKDEDTLPPYHILDRILELHIDQHQSSDEIVATGFDKRTVNWVVETVRKNEYKRKQAPPGLKVTSKAFGSGRRMPNAARYAL
ncbi:MAG: NAD+ synthase [Candidatus Latescibacterota bacterium]|nr:MAG: NAD+ synthase [Candidatus Latescibacterota bacterium]